MPPKKRAHAVIDLVSSDSDDSAPRPSKRTPGDRSGFLAGHNGARGFGGATPNTQRTASSVVIPGQSSQYSSFNEADDDLIDLTQAPDGPPRELYGTLGTVLY